MKHLILTITMLLFCHLLYAQLGENDEYIDNSNGDININAIYQDNYEVHEINILDTVRINLNTLAQNTAFELGSSTTLQISLTNDLNQNAKIYDISDPCSCLAITWPNTAVTSGSTINIDLKYRSTMPGPNQGIFNVYIYDEALKRLIALKTYQFISVNANIH